MILRVRWIRHYPKRSMEAELSGKRKKIRRFKNFP